MPRFSVIIPAFNRLQLLQRTLDSIWAQRFTDYEIIIVDDGSTDGTGEYLNSLGSRVHVLKQANAGPGAARNQAIRRAAGEYLAFLDSDDLWLPWSLASYDEVIRRHQGPSIVFGKMQRFDSEDAFTQTSELPAEDRAWTDYLAAGPSLYWYGISAFVIKRELLPPGQGFPEARMNGEDLDLILRLGTAPGFVEVKNPVTYGYREHGGNVRHDLAKNARGILHLVQQEENGNYPGGPSRALERWAIISPLLRSCSIACLKAGVFRDAWQMYGRTFRWHVALRRWKYLLAFPLFALQTSVKGRPRQNGPSL
jgi:glycosyltransferase involved in cell wall biosynthesis